MVISVTGNGDYPHIIEVSTYVDGQAGYASVDTLYYFNILQYLATHLCIRYVPLSHGFKYVGT